MSLPPTRIGLPFCGKLQFAERQKISNLPYDSLVFDTFLLFLFFSFVGDSYEIVCVTKCPVMKCILFMFKLGTAAVAPPYPI
jgi:hypothetical protein